MTYPNTQFDHGQEPQPETQPTSSHRHHRRAWHQDPIVRTWLLPPAVGAALGVLFGLGTFLVNFVLSLFVDSANMPHLLELPFVCYTFGYLGAQAGLIVSTFIQFCKLPAAQRHNILKALWKGVCALTLLFAVLMSFGLLGSLLGNHRL